MGKKKTSTKKTTQDEASESATEISIEPEVEPPHEIQSETAPNVVIAEVPTEEVLSGQVQKNIEENSITSEEVPKNGESITISQQEEDLESIDKLDESNELDKLDDLDATNIDEIENIDGMDEYKLPTEVSNDTIQESTIEIDNNDQPESDIVTESQNKEDAQKSDEDSLLKEGISEIIKEEEESSKNIIPSSEGKTVTFKELAESTTKKTWVEAAMFIAGRPVSIEELGIKLELKKKEVEDVIHDLAMEYMDRQTSIEIVQVGDKFSMQIKPEYTEKVKAFTSGGLIPEAVMRTLTIIALKQPISKSMVIKMRGASAYEHIKFLVDRGFLETYKKGRSSDLSTTDQFSDTFGLSRDHKKLKQQLIEQLGVAPAASSDTEEVAENAVPKQPE